MFFATSRLGSRKNSTTQSEHNLKDVTDEFVHPSRVLFTEEVVLGICMVITGLLYAFAQMPSTVLSTASASKSLMKRSIAGFAPASRYDSDTKGIALIDAAQPMLTALRKANALENSRDFSPRTRAAWAAVQKEGKALATRFVQIRGKALPLWIHEAEKMRIVRLEEKLTDMLGEARDMIHSLRMQSLSPEQQDALQTAPENRTEEQAYLASHAENSISVSWETAAGTLAEPQRTRAKNLCAVLHIAKENYRGISSCRDVLNYDYWMAVSTIASTPDGMKARESLQRAERAAETGDFEEAQSAYEEGLTALQASIMENPKLSNKAGVIEEISNQIGNYKKVIEEQGKEFDTTFSLENVLRSNS
ncbi:MAG: hypothetical protein MUQ67_07130 [Pirellulales bacterium]|nr:hypothetical protein [Pirellulales bacterium]